MGDPVVKSDHLGSTGCPHLRGSTAQAASGAGGGQLCAGPPPKPSAGDAGRARCLRAARVAVHLADADGPLCVLT